MDTDRFGTDLARELARLKRRGSAVLVRGDGHDLGVCTDLLGSDEERRLRLLVRTSRSAVLPVPPDGAAIVHVTASDARSSSRGDSSAFDEDAVVRRVDGTGGIEPVASAVAEQVDHIAARGVGPGELRVCLGRLDGYLDRNGVDAVSDAVGGVTDLVRGYGGMCHAHLGTDPPDPLQLAFDVTVETRVTEDRHHQHRWYLHASGIDTGWLRR